MAALLPAAGLTAATLAALHWGAPAWLFGTLAVAGTALLGPPVYRLVFRPMAGSSVLTLLIVAMALHYVLVGAGLVLFGPEASRTPAFSDADFTVGPMDVSGHSLWVAGCCVLLVVALRWLFRFTLLGKALRATASNPLGARLMGIDQARTGGLAFLLAAAIGGLAGLLIAPISPISYDSGFLTGLKGFIAAVLGGLASYPVAAVGALGVGVIESLSAFWVSAYSAAIVFGLLLPRLGGAVPAAAAQRGVSGRRVLGGVLPLLVVLALPGLLPEFYVTLFSYVGLAALVAVGLVLMTGVAGQTSFGQAAFAGIAAYATAVLTRSYGWSPWLSLPAALALVAAAALLVGLVTVRLSGHFLPLGTIAWGSAAFYLFGTLPGLGGYNGTGGVPGLARSTRRTGDGCCASSACCCFWFCCCRATCWTAARAARSARWRAGGRWRKAWAWTRRGWRFGCSSSPPCMPACPAGCMPTCSASSARRRST